MKPGDRVAVRCEVTPERLAELREVYNTATARWYAGFAAEAETIVLARAVPELLDEIERLQKTVRTYEDGMRFAWDMLNNDQDWRAFDRLDELLDKSEGGR